MTDQEIYDKGTQIANELSLRPVIVVPKGTKGLLGFGKASEFTVIRFIKELDGSWNSGVIFKFAYLQDKNLFAPLKSSMEFRTESMKSDNLSYVENLQAELLSRLN